MSHLTPDQLSAYVDQALDEAEREAAEQHLATCMECLHELADVARLQRELEHALVRDPGDAYFETFADRVRPFPDSGRTVHRVRRVSTTSRPCGPWVPVFLPR
jgi:anti-sigma factor RsiW